MGKIMWVIVLIVCMVCLFIGFTLSESKHDDDAAGAANLKAQIIDLESRLNASELARTQQAQEIARFRSSPVYPLYQKWEQGNTQIGEIIEQAIWLAENSDAIKAVKWFMDNGQSAVENVNRAAGFASKFGL